MSKIIRLLKKIFSSPLSRQYFSWIFIFGTCLSILITTAEIYSYYLGLRSELKINLEKTSSTYLRALKNSLWEHNSGQVKSIIDGITLDNRIKAVEIKNSLLDMESGIIKSNGKIIRIQTPIHIESSGKYHYLGELIVHADQSWITQQVYDFSTARLLNNFTKSIILILFSFLAFRILVNEHLEVINHFISSGKTLKSPKKILKLNRNTFAYKGQDEIDEVALAINQLGNELQDHVSKLVAMTRETEVVNLRLLEAMRMETLGKKVSSISHEFNNSLVIISGAIELISSSEVLPNEVRRRLEIAKSSVHTAKEHTRQLLHYSRKKTMSLSLIKIEEFIQELEETLTILINKKNNLVVLSTTQENIFINKEMLLSSIINLVKNSNEALKENGEITIVISNLSDKDIRNFNLNNKKKYLNISIIDNGPGIPNNLQEKLFEPFVTTKLGQGGTGIGLWTVYNFIQQISGLVTYQNAKGGGSHFSLIIPTRQDTDDPMNIYSAPSMPENFPD